MGLNYKPMSVKEGYISAYAGNGGISKDVDIPETHMVTSGRVGRNLPQLLVLERLFT